MSNRTANYVAFYVAEPFNSSNLGANTTPDFLYYNQLKAWKGADSTFPFIDAHEKTYNVRDNSEWETLKKRLHDRLNLSKNMVLFLSANTKIVGHCGKKSTMQLTLKGFRLLLSIQTLMRNQISGVQQVCESK